MIVNQIINSSINELSNITKVEFAVYDSMGVLIMNTPNVGVIEIDDVISFTNSPADSQVIGNYSFFKVMDDDGLAYILLSKGNDDNSYTMGRVAVSQLHSLAVAYKDRFDKDNFFQNLIMDNMLLVDIYNRAKKLNITVEQRRAVFLVEVGTENDIMAKEMMRGLFSAATGDFVTAVDEKNIILIKSLEADEGYEDLFLIARTIVDMMNTEAMVKARVSYGTVIKELREVSRSYKEATMAMDVGKIFYSEKDVIPYNTLGIGRLIYQLPTSLCEIFMKEVFGDNIPDDLDEEALNTINKFFENNLNVSETSRQLYVHRNTLVYRIEKLQKATGLDIRVFDDALTLKIALMVVSYMEYLKGKEKY